VTTFIDFRFLRALAEALFSGREREDAEVFLATDRDNYFVLDLERAPREGVLAEFTRDDGSSQARLERDPEGLLRILDRKGETIISAQHDMADETLLGVRLGPAVSGLKIAGARHETQRTPFGPDGPAHGDSLRLVPHADVRIMGRGSGRLGRWGELYYRREEPQGPCVELTMDWHHLRAGIPLFGTMTAEELIEAGRFRLRFRSYAYDRPQSDTTDFVRLFASSAPADAALHLTPSLYTPLTEGIPNVAFAVVESEQINAHIIERCNAMDSVMVPTAFVRDALQKAGTTAPIEVVSHGVDADYFRPPPSPGTLPGGKAFNFLAVGTHVERKNFRHLVRAFLEEFREREDVALYLLLRPEYMTTQHNVVLEFTEWERQWARKDSAPIYIWTGYLTRDHLRDFYANANAYVMPSNEGFGLTLLEAMSCGTPAIALDYGGVKDFVQSRNGILVKRGGAFVAQDIDTLPYVGDVFHSPDIAALRRAMRRLFESPDEVKRLGEQARQDALAMSWRRVGERVAGLLERVYQEWACREPGTDQALAHTTAHPSGKARLTPIRLTVVLCVTDDESARDTLKHLSASGDPAIRVMCLFTRYARIKDVLQARRHGFINYRWDGTTANAKSICRSVLGPGWLLLLKPGERLEGDVSKLHQALDGLPPDVDEMTLQCAGGTREPRIVHNRAVKESNEQNEVRHYPELQIN
jgi:glycosyltransferase involved in cell wall biosynthesis